MPSSLPKVTVGRIEAGQGFLITCTACPRIRNIQPSRYQADLYATEHRAGHQQPDPRDHITDHPDDQPAEGTR